LFHAEDNSLAEIAAHFNTTIRQIRHWKSTAMHQIHAAFGIETEEKREALRKQRRARRANRHTQSSDAAQSAKRNYFGVPFNSPAPCVPPPGDSPLAPVAQSPQSASAYHVGTHETLHRALGSSRYRCASLSCGALWWLT